MKERIHKYAGSLFMIMILSITAANINAQTKKLPDGSVVYSDGARKLPNGTVVNKDGTVRKRTTVRYPDGTKARRGERRHYQRRSRKGNGRWLPPGQAKKVYGGSATDYAPGQQKKWHKKGHKKDRN